ncbi:MAG TPA: hypothetical protein VFV94_19205 [Polyangiaceae bacterium]|nr:hypothetical protein [Polyangiaceae bacterium]
MIERALATLTTAALVGCGHAPLPPPSTPKPGEAANPRLVAPTESNLLPPPAAPPAGTPCGELGCLAFPTPRAAFAYTLRGTPRVVAIGEAHAQKAAPNVDSATRRFARDLMPELAQGFRDPQTKAEWRVKGLIVELLAPNRACEQHEEQAVAERTKPVTAPQAETNQNEFVALGFEAKKFGIQPEPLIPTCDELKGVLLTQEGDIAALLELIATITVREAADFLDHKPPGQAIAIYGGLLHNDTNPKPDHAAWSFGPRLLEHAGGSYVEVDLIVPEFVRNEEPWTNLPWFPHYDAARQGEKTWLYRTGKASFVLIFPKTITKEP